MFTFFIILSLNLALHTIELDLPNEHLPFYFANYPKAAEKCAKSLNCQFKPFLENRNNVCWGYEPFCSISKPDNRVRYSKPECIFDNNIQGWAHNLSKQIEIFEKQTDFAYIKERIARLKTYCKPHEHSKLKSKLKCSQYLEFCNGQNIMIDFRKLSNRLQKGDMFRYNMDVLTYGDISAYCSLDETSFKKQLKYISPLQSWAPEFRFFQMLNEPEEYKCDIYINETVYFMKIDAPVNMYHHFCDFLNLYASQHLNSVNNSQTFSRNCRIFIWESIMYRSSFEPVWKAFTQFPLWNLNTFHGKKVCFKKLIFPMLPRMIFGLYYNTPIIPNCKKSGLFHAFSKFILHRLRIDQKPLKNIKILFLSRKTKYRQILNEDILLDQLKSRRPYLSVEKVIFNWSVPFLEQIQHVANTDILIGIHGAGLTHLLFLPDWAVVFELYNCGDMDCYKDLTRLRGLQYATWINSSTVYKEDEGKHPHNGAPHEKFTNYRFEVEDFISLVDQCVKHVNTFKPKTIKISDEL